MKHFQLGLFIIGTMMNASIHADDLAQSKKILDRVNANAASTQSSINKLSQETDKKVTQYRQIIQKTDSIRQYNQQLQTLINSQAREVASLDTQAMALESTHRDIGPLMRNMIDGLTQFVRLDMPFLPLERNERIRQLNLMMDRADVRISEKYRRILKSYMIEVDYGDTIEAYEQTLELNGKTLNVEMLRIGRVALLYKTRDDQSLGFWDVAASTWQPLTSEYLTYVKNGLKIARKQTAPDLITIPAKLVGNTL